MRRSESKCKGKMENFALSFTVNDKRSASKGNLFASASSIV